jgi:hypothetical protein
MLTRGTLGDALIKELVDDSYIDFVLGPMERGKLQSNEQ